jgi:hypothetical protein
LKNFKQRTAFPKIKARLYISERYHGNKRPEWSPPQDEKARGTFGMILISHHYQRQDMASITDTKTNLPWQIGNSHDQQATKSQLPRRAKHASFWD